LVRPDRHARDRVVRLQGDRPSCEVVYDERNLESREQVRSVGHVLNGERGVAVDERRRREDEILGRRWPRRLRGVQNEGRGDDQSDRREDDTKNHRWETEDGSDTGPYAIRPRLKL